MNIELKSKDYYKIKYEDNKFYYIIIIEDIKTFNKSFSINPSNSTFLIIHDNQNLLLHKYIYHTLLLLVQEYSNLIIKK